MKKQVGSFLAGRGLMVFFLRSGVRIASFIYEGMQSLAIDIFSISVIIGESIFTHRFSKLAGNGSSEHDFDGEFIIIVLTSSTDTG